MSDLFGGGGGGAPEGIGTIEGLAPSPGAGRGRIIGAGPALKAIGTLGGPLAEFGLNRLKAKKDFNDDPAASQDGASDGKLVQSGGASAAAPAP
jgi:hypothetical protein